MNKKDIWFLAQALLVSTQSTCSRRMVGALIVDENNFILSTGYNGNPGGEVHCIDEPCPGSVHPTATELDKCLAIHAETNAIVRAAEHQRKMHTIFLTTTPCISCVKLIQTTSIKRVVALTAYPGQSSGYHTSGLLVEIADDKERENVQEQIALTSIISSRLTMDPTERITGDAFSVHNWPGFGDS